MQKQMLRRLMSLNQGPKTGEGHTEGEMLKVGGTGVRGRVREGSGMVSKTTPVVL